MTQPNDFQPPVLQPEGLDFPIATPHVEVSKPILRIDSGEGEKSVKAGTWSLGGICLEHLMCVFVHAREYRDLYSKSYKQDPNAPLCCVSWDGINAFGRGGRDLSQPLEARACAQEMSGGKRKRICKASMGDGDDWICRPSWEVFLMVEIGGAWSPAFFQCTSRSVRPTLQAYRNAEVQSLVSKAQNRIWHFMHQPSLIKEPGKTGYFVKWDAPRVITMEPDREFLDSFILENGREMLTQQYKDAHQRALDLANQPENVEMPFDESGAQAEAEGYGTP